MNIRMLYIIQLNVSEILFNKKATPVSRVAFLLNKE